LHRDIPDIYAEPGIPPELHIKTHYESLDIAGSNRVHYLCFSLPETLPSPTLDKTLQEELKNESDMD
jgi:tRNA (guanine-N7-)-methyltransferase